MRLWHIIAITKLASSIEKEISEISASLWLLRIHPLFLIAIVLFTFHFINVFDIALCTSNIILQEEYRDVQCIPLFHDLTLFQEKEDNSFLLFSTNTTCPKHHGRLQVQYQYFTVKPLFNTLHSLNSLWPSYTYMRSKLNTIGSDNGLSPCWGQAIIWPNAGILIIRPIGTNFNEIAIQIYTFSVKQIYDKNVVWNLAAILSRC